MPFILTLCLILFFPPFSYAAVPVFRPMENGSAAPGTIYRASPALAAGSGARFSKEFGPDELKVDPETGGVSWSIPPALPGEAFHLGVRATNADGSSYVTWVVKVGAGKFIYAGPSERYRTISAGTAAAAPGDTIVVRDGTYTGAANMVANSGSRGSAPPSGTSSAYTTLIAEHPGAVLIDGEGARVPIHLNGNYDSRDQKAWSRYDLSYIAIKGFVCGRAGSGGPISIYHAHHIKVIDCGAFDQATKDSGAVLYASRSGHVLVEGCYTWGNGRYGIVFYACDKAIVRRCLVRIDRTNAREPVGGIFHYATRHGRTQNCIVIDSDQPRYYRYQYQAGAFSASSGGARFEDWATTRDVVMANNIALNIYFSAVTNTRNGDNPGAPANQSDATRIENSVLWDIHALEGSSGDRTPAAAFLVPGDIVADQLTIGKLRSHGYEVFGAYFNGYDGESGKKHSIGNSIITDVKKLDGKTPAPLFYNWQRVDHNVIFDAGAVSVHKTADSNTLRVDPGASCLKYLPRIEPGCELEKAGASAARIGARVMFMRGRSGTLWGEDGYDSEDSAPMWPFPHQELIRAKLSGYSFDGGKLKGARGFCARGETLTRYIWGYLGYPVPPFDVAAKGGEGVAKIYWSPPGGSVLRYHVYQVTATKMVKKATVEGDLLTASVPLVSCGGSCTFVVTAVTRKGESGYSYPVSVTPSPSAPVPRGSGVPSGK